MQKSNAEQPLILNCQGQKMIAILHQSDLQSDVGILIIVGGPQYRVGSHRQFVLLARHLAASGMPTMRFDLRGMGDSEGLRQDFSCVDADIQAAVDRFFSACPGLNHIVLWGLCDGASAAVFYAYQNPRVKGLVLLNPWVFSEQGSAKTYLKHYYLQRLCTGEFWRKILAGKFDFKDSILSLMKFAKLAQKQTESTDILTVSAPVDKNLSLPIRMRECLRRFSHPVLFILSGQDLTAAEFKVTVQSDPQWQSLLAEPRIATKELSEADHTFSSAVWRNQVAEWTQEWVCGLT
jgi:uncharacterized protein